uniref:Uncharacterized protein n=1 Tax=Ascaris lumbricoides TaxID=6252 RepID=A0A0M3HQF7_ASCLU
MLLIEVYYDSEAKQFCDWASVVPNLVKDARKLFGSLCASAPKVGQAAVAEPLKAISVEGAKKLLMLIWPPRSFSDWGDGERKWRVGPRRASKAAFGILDMFR